MERRIYWDLKPDGFILPERAFSKERSPGGGKMDLDGNGSQYILLPVDACPIMEPFP
jgi:hypothetical protein